MTIDDLNRRIQDLEALVCRLIEGEIELRNLDLQPNALCPAAEAKSEIEPSPSPAAIRFFDMPTPEESPKCYGSIKAGHLVGGNPALVLRGESGAPLQMQSSKYVTIQASQYISLNTQTINLEAGRLNMDGEISAKIRYTDAFVWRSGQPPLKMINQDAGFPVITQCRGEFAGMDSHVKTYIDPDDGYWYLVGNSKKTLEIQAIVVGRV